jgi:hypothetical protein
MNKITNKELYSLVKNAKQDFKDALDKAAFKLNVEGKDCIISGFKKYLKVMK